MQHVLFFKHTLEKMLICFHFCVDMITVSVKKTKRQQIQVFTSGQDSADTQQHSVSTE